MNTSTLTWQEAIGSETRASLVPLIRELAVDMDTPISVYLKLRGLGPSFLLESVEGGEHLARFSMIGTQPRAIIRSWRQSEARPSSPSGAAGPPCRVVLEEEGHWQEIPLDGGDVLDVLKARLPSYGSEVDIDALPRFTGGAVGYMGYDLVRSFERIPALHPDTLGLPEATFLLADRLVLYDHVKHRLLVIAHARADSAESRREAEAALDEMVARLRRPLPTLSSPLPSPSLMAEPEPLQSAFDRAAYEEAVRRTKEYIAAGDIFQAVISRRAHRRTTARPFDIYRALRRVNPSPYMFYLELPDGLRIIGSSPEVLVRLDRGVVETRPLAGTRPRGATPEEDEALARELLADPKERAEHVMLVDLARNDLGRVCRFGTVHVPIMMEIERYSHVMHIVSEVRGELSPKRDAFDVIRACFPAGTLSGAPKVRAMEIIEEQEPEWRGPYGGAVGYFGFSGNMDTCITIRTLVMKGDRVYLQAGAGIVADSDPVREFEETTNKLRALSQALTIAERGEI
ncbi:MAG: anthranilate synthase component I [Chloroflexi bacterium]|nr:anthranilate synthase component I [Chloroflexota bacterium]